MFNVQMLSAQVKSLSKQMSDDAVAGSAVPLIASCHNMICYNSIN